MLLCGWAKLLKRKLPLRARTVSPRSEVATSAFQKSYEVNELRIIREEIFILHSFCFVQYKSNHFTTHLFDEHPNQDGTIHPKHKKGHQLLASRVFMPVFMPLHVEF